MNTTTITGASDDLIELDGQIREEFSHYARDDDDQGCLLAFSDGTLLSIKYDGVWRIARMAKGSCEYAHAPGSEVDDTNDVVTLIGDLRWCVFAERGQYNPALAKK